MHDLVNITLDNEMDLILAHKRSMKIAEFADLSLSAQTTFATAVSEVSRNIIESGKQGNLVLSVVAERRNNYIVATLKNNNSSGERSMDGLEYAKRLVSKFNVKTSGNATLVELYYFIPAPIPINTFKIDEWRNLFRNEPPISPYDELKRKNEQLLALAENIIKSENQYKLLTNSLPVMIFSIDKTSKILFTNEWLSAYSGYTSENLNKSKWKTVIHPDDYSGFLTILQNEILTGVIEIKTQVRLRNSKTGDFLWHQISLYPYTGNSETVHYWNGIMVDIHAQKLLEETLRDNIELKEAQQKLTENQQKLEHYIDELNRSNFELQQFAFIASHDLQEPVRKILFYSDFLRDAYAGTIDPKGLLFLTKMQNSALRMRSLIQDILSFSRVDNAADTLEEVNLNLVLSAALQDLEIIINEKKATVNFSTLPVIKADKRMMVQLFQNIIGNALKYSRTDAEPVVDILCVTDDRQVLFTFRDNGIGIKEEYLEKIFTLFQRLHGRETYDGSGLGLAICKRIVEVHKGKIWATGNTDQDNGVTFFVSFPISRLVN